MTSNCESKEDETSRIAARATAAAVALVTAVALFFFWRSKRGLFPYALFVIVLEAGAVLAVTAGIAWLSSRPKLPKSKLWLELDPRPWLHIAGVSGVLCLAALASLGLVQAAQVVGFSIAKAADGTEPRADPIAWTEFSRDGAMLTRAVVKPDVQCPKAEIDGETGDMQERLGVAPNAFTVRVCQIRHAATSRVKIGDYVSPVRSDLPKRILVIGDTGCRVAWYQEPQACSDEALWPFRRIADAAAALKPKPDLIIHVGDYYYRESPCPEHHLCDKESPFGDRWETWKAEFFDPSAGLLRAAPWIALRGNHEDCQRGGAGWFYFVDPADSVPLRGCASSADSYVLHFSGLDMVVLDTAHASDPHKRGDASQNTTISWALLIRGLRCNPATMCGSCFILHFGLATATGMIGVS
jgi:hypothetical protein